LKRGLVTAMLLALLAVPAAHADGDPASDIQHNSNVFLALESPQTSEKGRELDALTAAAAKNVLRMNTTSNASLNSLKRVKSRMSTNKMAASPRIPASSTLLCAAQRIPDVSNRATDSPEVGMI